MLKFVLILIVSNTLGVLSANLISRGSVTGHLNNNGLSSTIIKSQQLNSADSSLMRNANQQASRSFNVNRNKLNDPNSHFRLYYKSNSPGRSIKHELEHRFYKNPSYLSQNEQTPQYMYQEKLNQMPYLNGIQAVSSYSNVFPNVNELKMPTNLYASQYNPSNDQSTMLNLHYHDNIDYDNNQNSFDYNQMLQQQQQQHQLRLNLERQKSLEQYQQSRRNNLLKMMLMDFAPKTPQQSPVTRNLDNGIQYKIVNLRFKIEPQYGKFIGQGIVGTNDGVPGLLKSKHFNLFPNQLPALVKEILSASNQQHKQEPHLFFKKKRDDTVDSSTSASEELALNKRDASSNLDDQKEEKSLLESEVTSRMKRNMDDIENEIQSQDVEEDEGDERERRSDEVESDDESSNEERVDDNDFRESFKSLQRRNDEEEDVNGEEESDGDAERQERGFDEDYGGEESALMERDVEEGEENGDSSKSNEEVSRY